MARAPSARAALEGEGRERQADPLVLYSLLAWTRARSPALRSGGKKTCFKCGEVGHISKDCTKEAVADAPKPRKKMNNKQPKCYNW